LQKNYAHSLIKLEIFSAPQGRRKKTAAYQYPTSIGALPVLHKKRSWQFKHKKRAPNKIQRPFLSIDIPTAQL